jgi:hypothetical protein
VAAAGGRWGELMEDRDVGAAEQSGATIPLDACVSSCSDRTSTHGAPSGFQGSY